MAPACHLLAVAGEKASVSWASQALNRGWGWASSEGTPAQGGEADLRDRNLTQGPSWRRTAPSASVWLVSQGAWWGHHGVGQERQSYRHVYCPLPTQQPLSPLLCDIGDNTLTIAGRGYRVPWAGFHAVPRQVQRSNVCVRRGLRMPQSAQLDALCRGSRVSRSPPRPHGNSIWKGMGSVGGGRKPPPAPSPPGTQPSLLYPPAAAGSCTAC